MAKKQPAKTRHGRAAISANRAPSSQPINRDVSEGFTGIVQIARDVLLNSDIAYRTDRRLSEQMIRDPIVMAPLNRRMLATSELEWQVVPEDKDDQIQVQVASEIDKTVRNIPRLVNMFHDLQWAVFRGTGATEIDWHFDRLNREWCIRGHRPHHGDKIVYDIHGNPRIMTMKTQLMGRELTQPERDRMIIHTYDPEDGSFYEPAEAGYVFKGRGLRDVIWQYWWLKHNALRFWVRFIERFGGGYVLGKYPMHNAEAKTAITDVVKNLMSDSIVTVPVPPEGESGSGYGVELLTTAGSEQSSNIFNQFVDDWAGRHIRMAIEGQELTSQAGSSGLGGDLARVHQDTFKMLRDYDAVTLADTLSNQLVRRVQYFNFGYQPFQCRFEFVLDRQTWDETKSRIDALSVAGVPVPRAWLYETMGVPIPKDGEPTTVVGQGRPSLGAGMFPPGSNDIIGKGVSGLFRAALKG